MQATMRQLVTNGQLVFANGGWSMHGALEARGVAGLSSRVALVAAFPHFDAALAAAPSSRFPLQTKPTRCMATCSTTRVSASASSRPSLASRRSPA